MELLNLDFGVGGVKSALPFRKLVGSSRLMPIKLSMLLLFEYLCSSRL